MKLLIGLLLTGLLSTMDVAWASGPSPFAGCAPVDGEADRPAGAVEPAVLASPADPRRVVAAWTQDRFRGIVVGVSTDAGHTWRRVVVPGLTRCTGGSYDWADNVSLAAGADGTVSLSAHVFSAGEVSGRMVTRSTDGGLTWRPPVPVVTENRPGNGQFSGGALAADPGDPALRYSVVPKFFQPDLDGVPFRGQIQFSRSRDGGRSWQPARILYDTGDDALTTGHQLLVLPDHTVLDVFTLIDRPGPGQTTQLRMISSTDRGAHWSAPSVVADLDSVGTRDPESMDPVNAGSAVVAGAAVDPGTGRIYLVWQDARFTAGAADAIALSTSDDRGRTWSPATRINATPTAIPVADQQAFAPTVDVAPDHTVAVSYYDLRHNDSGPALWTDRWLLTCRRTCTETRLTRTPFDTRNATNLRIGRLGFYLGNTQGLTHTGHRFLAAFADTGRDAPPAIRAAGFLPD